LTPGGMAFNPFILFFPNITLPTQLQITLPFSATRG